MNSRVTGRMKQSAENSNKQNNDKVSKRGGTIEEAYQKIKEMLYSNELMAGQKLIYSNLGKRLGISITPIVQALNRLEASGFVSYIPNTGYFVSEITEKEAIELFEVREVLEAFVIAKAISNLNEKSVEEIHTAFQRQRQESANLSGRELAFLDAKFHLLIAEFARNDFVLKTLREVFEKMYLKYRPEYVGQMNLKQIISEHRAMFEAMKRKDVEGAVEAVQKHVRSARRRFLEGLRSRQNTVML